MHSTMRPLKHTESEKSEVSAITTTDRIRHHLRQAWKKDFFSARLSNDVPYRTAMLVAACAMCLSGSWLGISIIGYLLQHMKTPLPPHEGYNLELILGVVPLNRWAIHVAFSFVCLLFWSIQIVVVTVARGFGIRKHCGNCSREARIKQLAQVAKDKAAEHHAKTKDEIMEIKVADKQRNKIVRGPSDSIPRFPSDRGLPRRYSTDEDDYHQVPFSGVRKRVHGMSAHQDFSPPYNPSQPSRLDPSATSHGARAGVHNTDSRLRGKRGQGGTQTLFRAPANRQQLAIAATPYYETDDHAYDGGIRRNK